MTIKRDHSEMSSSSSPIFIACHNGSHLTILQKNALQEIAIALATKGKGITACDESAGLY